MSSYKYLGLAICLSRGNQSIEFQRRIGIACAAIGNLKEVFKSDLPTCPNRKVFDQRFLPILTYGTEIFSLSIITINKIQITQRAIECAILGSP